MHEIVEVEAGVSSNVAPALGVGRVQNRAESQGMEGILGAVPWTDVKAMRGGRRGSIVVVQIQTIKGRCWERGFWRRT